MAKMTKEERADRKAKREATKEKQRLIDCLEADRDRTANS